MNLYKYLCSLCLLVFLVACQSRLGYFESERSEHDVDIMSFNIRYDNPEDGKNRWDNRKEACVRMLKKTKPSVFGIQEGLVHQVEYLDDRLDEYTYYGGGREDGITSGEYTAVFYRHETFRLTDKGMFWLSNTPDIPSVGWDAHIKRMVTWVELEDKRTGKTLYVFNTHFDHQGKQAKRESAKLLVEKIKEITQGSTVPVFITGDFNGLLSNSMFNPILKTYGNTQKCAPDSDRKSTFNAFGRYWGILNLNIDFIFYNQVTPVQFETINEDYGVPYISDHYPILGRYRY